VNPFGIFDFGFWIGLSNRLIISSTLAALLFAFCSSAEAQQASKLPRIGIVTGISTDPSSRIKTFRQALQDLGYCEGKNILFEYRDNEGNRDRVPGIVAELVRLNVDVIFSTQAIVIREAKQATKTIPIIMAITPDPVRSGLVDSLARPGGNIIGSPQLPAT
jgi:putative ABC transport system substrate-binding protein